MSGSLKLDRRQFVVGAAVSGVGFSIGFPLHGVTTRCVTENCDRQQAE